MTTGETPEPSPGWLKTIDGWVTTERIRRDLLIALFMILLTVTATVALLSKVLTTPAATLLTGIGALMTGGAALLTRWRRTER
jgi:hypothetical protein